MKEELMLNLKQSATVHISHSAGKATVNERFLTCKALEFAIRIYCDIMKYAMCDGLHTRTSK